MKENGIAGSFWPSSAQKLLLQAVLADQGTQAEAWERLRPTFDPDALGPAAFSLLPLLYRRLENEGDDSALMPRLKGMYRRSWYVNQVRLERLLPALVALQQRELDPVVVGGWELACHYYEDLGSRPVRGMHLLVAPDQVEESLTALAQAGWPSDFDPAREQLRGRSSVWLAADDGVECVVHWRLFHEFVADAAEAEVRTERGLAFRVGEQPARALSPADELVNVCVGGARSSAWLNLQWLADAVIVMRSSGDALDWDRVVRRTESIGSTLRLRDALVYLARTVGAPVSESALDRLDSTPVSPRERLAHRAGGWKTTTPESLTRFLRATASDSVPLALARLPGFLRDEWGLARRSQVPATMARKAANRLARPLRGLARSE